jgi:hypothetical protein
MSDLSASVNLFMAEMAKLYYDSISDEARVAFIYKTPDEKRVDLANWLEKKMTANNWKIIWPLLRQLRRGIKNRTV